MKNIFYGMMMCFTSVFLAEAGTFNELLQQCTVDQNENLSCPPNYSKEVKNHRSQVSLLNQVLKADQNKNIDHWTKHFQQNGESCANNFDSLKWLDAPPEEDSIFIKPINTMIESNNCGDSYIENNIGNIKTIRRSKLDDRFIFDIEFLEAIPVEVVKRERVEFYDKDGNKIQNTKKIEKLKKNLKNILKNSQKDQSDFFKDRKIPLGQGISASIEDNRTQKASTKIKVVLKEGVLTTVYALPNS
jgi:hypothetical protein